MGRSVAQVVAANEASFRTLNEAIERGQWPGEDEELAAFRCECAQSGCNKLVSMTPVEYRHVREHPRRFLVLPGHEFPEVERVVESGERFFVVEKFGEAGTIAEETYQRG